MNHPGCRALVFDEPRPTHDQDAERALDVAAFPAARFVGGGFTFDGDKVQTVPGTLTLLGKSLPITLQAVRFNCYLTSSPP